MKILKHKGNTTNLHNHYNNVHRMHAETDSTMESTSKQLEMSTEDVENIMKENELHREPSPANITTLKRRHTLLTDNSSDNNIDIDDPITYQRNTDTDCQNECSVTSSHSRQRSKFKDRRQVKKNI